MKKELTIYTKKEKVYKKPKEEDIPSQEIFFKNKSEKYSITVDGIKFKVSELPYFHLLKQNLKFTLSKKISFNKGSNGYCYDCTEYKILCKCKTPFIVDKRIASWTIIYTLELVEQEEL